MNRNRPSSISFNSRRKEEVKALKIILLGEPGVGKTNIISRYLTNTFNENLNPTIGSIFGERNIAKDGVIYSLKIWDTTGQEKYNSITKLFVKGSQIVVLVYSIDDLQSFQKLDFWLNYINQELEEGKYILGILGNKRDLYESELVSEEDGKKFAKKNNAIFSLVSAKIDQNLIAKFFETLLDEFINKFGINFNDTTYRLDDTENENKKCC